MRRVSVSAGLVSTRRYMLRFRDTYFGFDEVCCSSVRYISVRRDPVSVRRFSVRRGLFPFSKAYFRFVRTVSDRRDLFRLGAVCYSSSGFGYVILVSVR